MVGPGTRPVGKTTPYAFFPLTDIASETECHEFWLSLGTCVGHKQWEQSLKREILTFFRRSQVVERVWSNDGSRR